MQNNIYEKVLGLFFLISKEKQKEWIDHLDENWFDNSFTKNVYNSINELIFNNQDVDILSVLQNLRKKSLVEKDTPLKLSKLTTSITFNEKLNFKTIINECFYNYSVRQCYLMVQNVNSELSSEAPNSTKIVEEIDKIKTILTEQNTNTKQNNYDLINVVLEKHENARLGIPIGLELGWDNLRGKVLLEPDDVMIVGGRPAMGKTAWSISLVKNLVFQQKKHVLYFSLEMAKDRIIRRLISNLTGIDSNKIKYGQCTDYELSKIEELKSSELWNMFHIVDGSQNVKDIEKEVSQISNKFGLDVFVIDYIQKIMPVKSDNRYQEVTKISNDIKRIVMIHRIPCIALAQLSRDSAKTGKRPTLPDLKESGEIEQDASIVGFLHRPEYYGETTDANGNDMTNIGEFIVAKNRDGSVGINEFKVDLPLSKWDSFDRDSYFSTLNNYQNEEF